MVQKINVVNDINDLTILHKKAQFTEELDDIDRELIRDLAETAEAHRDHCLGLSANQIWKDMDNPPRAIFVIKATSGWVVVINPVIEKSWNKKIIQPESCMSIPGVIRKIERPRHIRASFYDVDLKLVPHYEFFDMPARIFLHEYDHLQGRLIIDE